MKAIVVDDDDFSAQILVGLMRNMGFEVERGRNGLDAMRLLLEGGKNIQLVITDVYMPEMNGLDLFRTIRSHPTFKELPVILVSGLADINLVTEAAKAGCSHFLVKPVKREKVLEKVRELIPMQRLWLKEPQALLQELEVPITQIHQLAERFHDQVSRLLQTFRGDAVTLNGKKEFRPLMDSAELLGTDDLKDLLAKFSKAETVSQDMVRELVTLRGEIEALRDKVVHRAREEAALAILAEAEEKRRAQNPNEVQTEVINVAGRQIRRETGPLHKVILQGPRTLSHELKSAAANGDAHAQYEVGLCYLRGYGCNASDEEARSWLEKAAAQGQPDALNKLGLLTLQTEPLSDDQAWELALDYIGRAANHGHTEARYWKEQLTSHPRESFDYLQLAKQNDPGAQYKLGLFYDLGIEIDQNVPEAMYWLGLSAKQGYLDAQYRLGIIHLEERSASSSHREALKLFKDAAELDHPEAQYSLGRMYNLALGVPLDAHQAIRWYEKAARQGHVKAQFELANTYESAAGITSNPKEALRWYLVAAANGFSTAAKRVADIQGSLDRASIHEAETLARSTLETINNLRRTGAIPVIESN